MRRIVRFESADGSLVLPLPLLQAEQEDSQSVRTATAKPPMVNYAADLHGSATTVVGVAEIRHRAVLISPDDADLDQLRALLRRIGRGKLWMQLDDGSKRWSWARATDLASYTVAADKPLQTAVTIGFLRLSDWYAAAEQVVTATLSGSPVTVTLTVAGTVPTTVITITLTAGSANGFTNPQIRNVAAGLGFTVQATASAAGQQIRVQQADLAFRRAQYYDGTVWTAVNLLPDPNQAQAFALNPGVQAIRITGASNATIEIRWSEAYG